MCHHSLTAHFVSMGFKRSQGMEDGKHIHVDRRDGALEPPFQGTKSYLIKTLIYDISGLAKTFRQ